MVRPCGGKEGLLSKEAFDEVAEPGLYCVRSYVTAASHDGLRGVLLFYDKLMSVVAEHEAKSKANHRPCIEVPIFIDSSPICVNRGIRWRRRLPMEFP